MALSLSDLILQQVKSQAGSVDIPSNIKNQVLNGLSDSIFGSFTQTAAKAGGVDQIKQLLTGKADAAKSPITGLAGKLFAANVVKKLGLSSGTGGALTALIPGIMGKLGGVLKDQDGDGDVDLNDIIITLTGKKSAAPQAGGGILGGIAKGVLGGILKK